MIGAETQDRVKGLAVGLIGGGQRRPGTHQQFVAPGCQKCLFLLGGRFAVHRGIGMLRHQLARQTLAFLVIVGDEVEEDALSGYGAAFGLFPIGWIVLAAIFLYTLTVDTGRFEVVKHSVLALSPDRRIQALLIAF